MKSKTIRKILIISGIVILGILLVLAGGLIYLDRNAEKIVEDLLEKEYKGSEISHVYEIKYDNIHIGLFSGNLKIKNLKITPRPAFYEADDTLRLKYPELFDVYLPSVSITGIDENFSLSPERISLDEIRMIRPEITLIDHLTSAEKKQAKAIKANRKTKKKTGEAKVKKYSLKSFVLSRGSFGLFDHKKQSAILGAGDININIRDLTVEGLPDKESLLNILQEHVKISVGDFSYPTPDGMYEIRVGEVQKKPGEPTISISNFELIPGFDKMEFGVKAGKQTDRMQIEIDHITVENFDARKYMMDQEVFIGRIVIDGLYLNAFRDKNVPFDYDRYPKMPQQSLASLNLPLDIREVLIKDSEVLYEQVNKDATDPGKVPIKNLYATLVDVSNIPGQIRKFGPMFWDVKANFFNAASLELQVEFTENIHEPDFTFSGTMEQMDMTAFNQMIEPTEYLRIESGVINSMDFEASANSEYVEGELMMLYSDLKIKGLRKVTKKERDEMGFFSALANVVIRQFNPPKNKEGEPVSSQIFFVRDKNKGIFNYLAKGLISGIKATILPSVSSPKKRFEKQVERKDRKDEKQERKEQRRKKRQERKDKK